MFKRLILLLTYFLPLTAPMYGQDELLINLRNHVTTLASDSFSGRGFGFPEKQMAVDYITSQYRLAGFSEINNNYVQEFFHFSGSSLIDGKNIIGLIEGSDPVLKKEYIIVGAHYDHLGWKISGGAKTVYNGADDNASGVATIIETGKILLNRKERLKRSVLIIAFDGQEAGLIGSSAFADNLKTDSLKIKAMFSLDMVGMFGKNMGIDLNGFSSIKNGDKIVSEIARHDGIPVVTYDRRIESRTDTWSFGKINIPAFYITTGLLSPFHKPEDDSNLLDYEGMAKVVTLLSDIVTDMGNMDTIEGNEHFIKKSVDPLVLTGLTFGAGTNHLTYKGIFYSAKPVIAIETGITSQIKLASHLYFQPALFYEMTGSNTEDGKIRMHSVSPRFDFLISTPADDLSKPIIFALLGGFLRYNFAVTGKGSPMSQLYSDKDAGIELGAGERYMKLQMSLVFKYGLKNISTLMNSESYNRGLSFQITKFF